MALDHIDQDVLLAQVTAQNGPVGELLRRQGERIAQLEAEADSRAEKDAKHPKKGKAE